MNPLAQKLGLLDDDIKREDKLFRLCRDLGDKIMVPVPGALTLHIEAADMSTEAALAADWRLWPQLTPTPTGQEAGPYLVCRRSHRAGSGAGADAGPALHVAMAGASGHHRSAMPRLSRWGRRPGARRQPQ